MAYHGPDPKVESLTATESLSGSAVVVQAINTSNTASSQAKVISQVAGGTADDAIYQAVISGVQTYTWGIDNSASDAWVLAASSTLGTTNAISVSTAAAVTIGTLTVSGALLTASIGINGALESGYSSSNKGAGGNLGFSGAYSADAVGAQVTLAKSRNASISSHTIVQSGDTLGSILFKGSNGTSFDNAAAIVALSDSTPGASADMPGRLSLQTSADGSATLTERLRITSTGQTQVYDTLNSASTPTIAALNDTDTGMFFPAANAVGIVTGGTERVRVNSAGVVTAPTGYFDRGLRSVSNSNYTITDTDGSNVIWVVTGASNRTITLPTPASTNSGRIIQIMKVDTGTGQVQIVGTIGGSSASTTVNAINKSQGSGAVMSDGTSWVWLIPIHEYGTYTPTGTNAANTSAWTMNANTQFYRVGDKVTVSGQGTITLTPATNVAWDITLPCATTFGASTQAGGSCVNFGGGSGSAGLSFQATSNSGAATVRFNTNAGNGLASAVVNSFHFTYQIV